MKTAKVLLAGGLALAGSLGVADALACGAPFGPGMSVDPHQDVILVHKGGVETYVFQPTVCGEASSFGLILPVPSLLSASPSLVDPKAFKTVDALSKPAVQQVTRCRGRDGFADAGVGGYGDASNGGATVVASGRVGFLDWVQLEATDQASFTAWLDANGYPHDANAAKAFDYYVAKHWYFVAFKIAKGTAHTPGTCDALGPIALTFPTAVPVIPSRMATAGEQPVYVPPGAETGIPYNYGFTWRLFGISDSSAEVATTTGSWSVTRSFSGALGAGDLDGLTGLAAAGDRLTKLQIWFGSGASEDVKLTRAAPSDYREIQENVTWVDCDDAGPGEDTAPVVVDTGAGADAGGLGASPAVGGGSCSSSSSGARGGLFGFGVALALGLAARARRVVGARGRPS